MRWKGEYPDFSKDGVPVYSDMVDVPKQEMTSWSRRVESGEAKKPQMTSEYTMRSKKACDLALYYLNTIEIYQKKYPYSRLRDTQ